MQYILTRICCYVTAVLALPTISARVIVPLSALATRSDGLNGVVDRPQERFALPLAMRRLNDNSAYSARPAYGLDVENAGTDDAEDATLGVGGQEVFVNTKVRRIARLMRGKHPPYVRFG